VEVEATGEAVALPHFPALNVWMPDRRVGDAPEAYVEQSGRDVEHALEDAVERQIGPHRLGVERELRATHALRPERRLPAFDGVGGRVVGALAREQLLVVLAGPLR